MGRAVSNDLRVRMVRGIAAGKSRRAVAAQFEVAPSTAVRVQARYAATGSVEPAQQGRPQGSGKLDSYREVGIENLVGSDHADSLTGNRLANRLEGGAGADTLSGGTGDDRYAYGLGDGDDVIVNAETAPATADDRLVFGQGIDTDDLWFTQEGDDLLVQILDNQRGSLRIQDWYAAGSTGDAAKLDAFETSAGQVLVEATLQQLVDAMAGLPANGSDVVDSYKDQVPASVQTAISQAWQNGA